MINWNRFSAAVNATFSGERPHCFCISVLVFVFLKLLFIDTVKYSREPVVQCPRLESHSTINFLSINFTSYSISSMLKPFVQGNRQNNNKPPRCSPDLTWCWIQHQPGKLSVPTQKPVGWAYWVYCQMRYEFWNKHSCLCWCSFF